MVMAFTIQVQEDERGKITAVKPLYQTSTIVKAIWELGPRQVGLYACYKVGLKLGLYRWYPKRPDQNSGDLSADVYNLHPLIDLPDPAEVIDLIGNDGLSQLLEEADEIVAGKARLFGTDAVQMDFSLPDKLVHWTAYHPDLITKDWVDIKFLWEPARMGWAFTLGRAYHLTEDERYPEAFWNYLEKFLASNPAFQGPNWISGQEAALRILAMVYAAQFFSQSQHTSRDRTLLLAASVAAHAIRIPPTLIYARAQNNNHLLSEAAGLITASQALPNHPRAHQWRRLGWRWFNHALATQISPDGTYVQHSANYHRLMLQLALWIQAIQTPQKQIKSQNLVNLDAAASWLFAITDPGSGRVPNLGPNDGAYIHPMTVLPFHDYRPVVQAATQAFLGQPAFRSGKWDELGLWLGMSFKHLEGGNLPFRKEMGAPEILIHPKGDSWAYLRIAKFDGRPGHADQLHLDLWWRGLNIAQDAGTYLYNGKPPWENALTHTAVHNTVMIDDMEQMTRVGRFLYVDRAEAEIVSQKRGKDDSLLGITASHDGYRQLGIHHQRAVTAHQNGRWSIEDSLKNLHQKTLETFQDFRLHWLLPDWDFELLHSDCGVKVLSPFGWISLVVHVSGDSIPFEPRVSIIRAGEIIQSTGTHSPVWGWVSPTYGVRQPALSVGFNLRGKIPVIFRTEWRFPDE